VQEIIGSILIFGILSVILVLSMIAFNVAQQAARGRAVELRAESAAARVAGVVVQVAVVWEQQHTTSSDASVAYRVALDDQFEGLAYTVRLEPSTTIDVAADCSRGAHPDEVCVKVPAANVVAIAPVFSAAAPTSLDICATSVGGGALNVRINPRAVYDGQTHGTTTLDSASAGFSSRDVGTKISGTGIPVGATITSVASPTSITISSAATTSTTNVALFLGLPAACSSNQLFIGATS
jgi:hypothetical protein